MDVSKAEELKMREEEISMREEELLRKERFEDADAASNAQSSAPESSAPVEDLVDGEEGEPTRLRSSERMMQMKPKREQMIGFIKATNVGQKLEVKLPLRDSVFKNVKTSKSGSQPTEPWSLLRIDEILINQTYSKNPNFDTEKWLLYKWSAQMERTASRVRMTDETYRRMYGHENLKQFMAPSEFENWKEKNDSASSLQQLHELYEHDTAGDDNTVYVMPRITVSMDDAPMSPKFQFYREMGFVPLLNKFGCLAADKFEYPDAIYEQDPQCVEMRVLASTFFQRINAWYTQYQRGFNANTPPFLDYTTSYTVKRQFFKPEMLVMEYINAMPEYDFHTPSEFYKSKHLVLEGKSFAANMVSLLVEKYASQLLTRLPIARIPFFLRDKTPIKIMDLWWSGNITPQMMYIYILDRLLMIKPRVLMKYDGTNKEYDQSLKNVHSQGTLTHTPDAINCLYYVAYIEIN